MEFPLSKAPDILFDQQIWEIFKTYFDTPQIAVERISGLPEVPGCYYHRDEDRQLPESIQERDRVISEARHLGLALLYGFQDLLLDEQVIAMGRPYWSETKREIIPAEQWRRLWPDFANNIAMAVTRPNDRSCSRYDDIRLIINGSAQARSAELIAGCSRFLRQRQAEGESYPKKLLIEEANQYFGFSIQSRIFNAAYKDVYKKARGRPRKK
jgi:hypothetical protein